MIISVKKPPETTTAVQQTPTTTNSPRVPGKLFFNQIREALRDISSLCCQDADQNTVSH